MSTTRVMIRTIIAASAAASTLISCGSAPSQEHPSSSGARQVTTAEAERLAVMRFRNYQATGVHFSARLKTGQSVLNVDGDVDYRQRLGYARVTGVGSSFTLEWDATTLLAWPSKTSATRPPATIPTITATRRALAPTASDVDALLAVLLALGQDRPDNAQLIKQNGSRWLRAATVGTRQVDVIRGPIATGAAPASQSPLTFWIDATGQLLRVDASFGGGGATPVRFNAAAFSPFTRSDQLPPE